MDGKVDETPDTLIGHSTLLPVFPKHSLRSRAGQHCTALLHGGKATVGKLVWGGI